MIKSPQPNESLFYRILKYAAATVGRGVVAPAKLFSNGGGRQRENGGGQRMKGGDNRGSSIICACCGRAELPIYDSGRAPIDWLRKDIELGLGVCSFCPEWLDAWDRGYRDVRLHPDDARAGKTDRPSLELLIQNAGLPSFSHVLLEIYDMLSSDTAGADQIAQLLQTDAALTARTLKLANSAYYSCSRKIGTITQALTRIGLFDLWWLLFTTEVKSLFFGIDRQLMDMETFWRHSLLVACVSRTLAEQQRCGEPRELFVAGLVHDIGKLLILQRIPIEYGTLLERAALGESLIELESTVLGFTHADAGGELLDRWKLPHDLVICVRGHHQAYEPLTPRNLVAAADRLAHLLDAPPENRESGTNAEQTAMEAGERLFRRLVDLVL